MVSLIQCVIKDLWICPLCEITSNIFSVVKGIIEREHHFFHMEYFLQCWTQSVMK